MRVDSFSYNIDNDMSSSCKILFYERGHKSCLLTCERNVVVVKRLFGERGHHIVFPLASAGWFNIDVPFYDMIDIHQPRGSINRAERFCDLAGLCAVLSRVCLSGCAYHDIGKRRIGCGNGSWLMTQRHVSKDYCKRLASRQLTWEVHKAPFQQESSLATGVCALPC